LAISKHPIYFRNGASDSLLSTYFLLGDLQ